MDALYRQIAGSRRNLPAVWVDASYRRFKQIDGPTWLVAVAIYAGWFALTWWFHVLPGWTVLVLGGWFVCWQGSLQHEATHGHPTRLNWLNTAIVVPPLGLWMPYTLYRESHLDHHRTTELTVPGKDPESHYVDGDKWRRSGALARATLVFNNTLLGRMTVGPALTAVRFWSSELRQVIAGHRDHLWTWAGHAVLVAVLVYWIVEICQIAWWQYVLLFAWPGLSLTLLRSYAEHRPGDAHEYRSVIVEGNPITNLLYLNNNLHALHHTDQNVPWFELPAAFEAAHGQILHRNGGYRFTSYADIARRYLFTPKDAPLHPGAKPAPTN